MSLTMLRVNFVHPDPTDGAHMADRYRTGIELAEFGDQHGVSMVITEEHQATPVGWSPTPLLTASMVLARTTHLSVVITAVLVPLHDPVRLAQQIAVLDLVSRGRIAMTAGLGYRPVEYAALGRDWHGRGRRLDECLDTMLRVWSGEPFEIGGETIVCGPRPYTRPHPLVLIGGGSAASARRAARFGFPFQPMVVDPEIEAVYRAACETHGTTPVYLPPEQATLVNVVEDPDRAWAELGRHYLFEAMTYMSFQTAGQRSSIHTTATSVEELRAENVYRFLTPEQAVEQLRTTGALPLHPLCGGMPIDAAWESVQLYADQVAPRLQSSK